MFFPFPFREDTEELRRGKKGGKGNQMHRTEKTVKGEKLMYIKSFAVSEVFWKQLLVMFYSIETRAC